MSTPMPPPTPAQPPVPQPPPVQPTAQAPRTGTIAWGLGFLAYVPIPMVNVVVAGVTQLVVGLRQRRHGGLAAVNGVRAANWGLTQLCHPVLLAIIGVVTVVTGTPSPTGGYSVQPWAGTLLFVMIGLWFLLSLVQLLYALIGVATASKGDEVRLPVIRFIRPPDRDERNQDDPAPPTA